MTAPPLAIPAGRRYPDEFYKQVVNLRQEATAKELADAVGMPESTVHRWTKEARRRGILPSTAEQMILLRAHRLLYLMKAKGVSPWVIRDMECVVAQLEKDDAS